MIDVSTLESGDRVVVELKSADIVNLTGAGKFCYTEVHQILHKYEREDTWLLQAEEWQAEYWKMRREKELAENVLSEQPNYFHKGRVDALKGIQKHIGNEIKQIGDKAERATVAENARVQEVSKVEKFHAKWNGRPITGEFYKEMAEAIKTDIMKELGK